MPQPIAVNFWAILIATILNMIIGFLWYGPLFGRTWAREIGMTDEEMRSMPRGAIMRTTIISFVGALVLYYVLSHSVTYAGANTVSGGAFTGFWNWLGFIAVVLLNAVAYERRSFTLYSIHAGYYLVVMAIGGALLAVWR